LLQMPRLSAITVNYVAGTIVSAVGETPPQARSHQKVDSLLGGCVGLFGL